VNEEIEEEVEESFEEEDEEGAKRDNSIGCRSLIAVWRRLKYFDCSILFMTVQMPVQILRAAFFFRRV
jgi:hypothetical protein